MTRLLSRLGFENDVRGNGGEALAALAERDYALVLMDIQMPVMDGFEATRAVRTMEEATGEHIPIVAVTANAQGVDRENSLAAGMDDYLTKPLQKDELLRVIDHFPRAGLDRSTGGLRATYNRRASGGRRTAPPRRPSEETCRSTPERADSATRRGRVPSIPLTSRAPRCCASTASTCAPSRSTTRSYRMPRPETLAGWSEQVPPEFRFVIKVSQRITHRARLKDVDELFGYLWTAVGELGHRRGPLLVQLPPNFKLDEDRLTGFSRRSPRVAASPSSSGTRPGTPRKSPSSSRPTVPPAC